MNTGEHYMATDVEWDPTGRYFMTGVSWWAHKVDNGFFIWSFQGKILQRHPIDQFCHFLWRPRPPSLLDEKAVKEVKKDLKKYQKVFEIKDRMSQTKASKELIEKRRALYNEFAEFRSRHQITFQEYKEFRVELREGVYLLSLLRFAHVRIMYKTYRIIYAVFSEVTSCQVINRTGCELNKA